MKSPQWHIMLTAGMALLATAGCAGVEYRPAFRPIPAGEQSATFPERTTLLGYEKPKYNLGQAHLMTRPDDPNSGITLGLTKVPRGYQAEFQLSEDELSNPVPLNFTLQHRRGVSATLGFTLRF